MQLVGYYYIITLSHYHIITLSHYHIIRMSWIFGIAFTLDCIAILLALYTVIKDRFKYGNYSKTGVLGVITLLVCGWVAVGYLFFHQGYAFIASAMVWVPAIPLLGYALFILAFIILKPDMK